MRKYETTFIVDSLIKIDEIEGIISKIEKFISNNGGQIEEINRIGKKRLAYEIKKRQYGFYVSIFYQAQSKLNRLLEREYQLDENILRYLTILIEPKAEKALQMARDAAAAKKSAPIKTEKKAATTETQAKTEAAPAEEAVVEEAAPEVAAEATEEAAPVVEETAPATEEAAPAEEAVVEDGAEKADEKKAE